MTKQPAPTASAIGPCPTIIQIVGRPGTGRLPRAISPSRPPHFREQNLFSVENKFIVASLRSIESGAVLKPYVFEDKMTKN